MSDTTDKWLDDAAELAARIEGDKAVEASPPTGQPVLRLPREPAGLRDTNPYQSHRVPPRRLVGGV